MIAQKGGDFIPNNLLYLNFFQQIIFTVKIENDHVTVTGNLNVHRGHDWVGSFFIDSFDIYILKGFIDDHVINFCPLFDGVTYIIYGIHFFDTAHTVDRI